MTEPNREADSPVISLRLRADLAAQLRDIATGRGVTLSDILRDAAGGVLCQAGRCTCPNCPGRTKGWHTAKRVEEE